MSSSECVSITLRADSRERANVSAEFPVEYILNELLRT